MFAAAMPTFSILIPVYNEERFLEEIVQRVLEAPLPEMPDAAEPIRKELVLVDDASTDGTPGVIERLAGRHPEIRAFRQPRNLGKGGAIRRAIEEMTGDFAIIQDADLEYDPAEYPLVLGPIVGGEADVVYGSRFLAHRRWTDWFVLHRAANRFLTLLSNVTTGLRLSDMETCYKAFRGDLLHSIPLRSNRFGIEPEITAKVARRGAEICEVPISYYGRLYSEGKKIGWKDGISAIWTILKYWWIDDSSKSDEPSTAGKNSKRRPSSMAVNENDSPGHSGSATTTRSVTGPSSRKRSGCPCDRRPGHWR